MEVAEEENEAKKQTVSARAGTKEHAKQTIIQFFKDNRVTKGNSGNIKYGDTQSNISFKDLISDLVTNNRKVPSNLTKNELNTGLAHLGRLGMPAGYIRNVNLREKYKAIKERQQSADTPGTSQATPVSVRVKRVTVKRLRHTRPYTPTSRVDDGDHVDEMVDFTGSVRKGWRKYISPYISGSPV